jgi:hypothetical protein
MLSFESKKELQNCEELQNMGRYQWQKVFLKGEEVIACTTNQQYEDIIWGGLYEIFKELFEYYGKSEDEVMDDITDLSSEVRDHILDKLEKEENIKFVDVFDEY